PDHDRGHSRRARQLDSPPDTAYPRPQVPPPIAAPVAAGRRVAAHRPDPTIPSSLPPTPGMACPWRPVARRFASQCDAQDPRHITARSLSALPRPAARSELDQPDGPEGAEPRMSQPVQDTAAQAPL